MKLVFIGADHEVTGSCHYMEVGDKKFCVDIGMEQGQDLFENQEIPVNPSEIDFILLTHAHIDHTGLLPMLFARGFRGQVYATKATVDLSQSGGTGKQDVPAVKFMNLCIRWKMP